MNNKGLTLIEVLLVILVLGIVSAISIPSMTTVFSNANKDNVLNTAVSIERAAKNFCRQDNYNSCPDNTQLTRDQLEPFLIGVDPDYDIFVWITNGIRDILVTYSKQGELSFPYTASGSLVLTIINGIEYAGASPTTSTRSLVNRPRDLLFESPDWNEELSVGDFFIYNNRLWQVREGGPDDEPPAIENDNLFRGGPYQEITEFYRVYNTYVQGDIVKFNGATFIALVDFDTIIDNMESIEPGNVVGWQEQTPFWREFNVYSKNDVVSHNGAQFKALINSINLDVSNPEPGTSWGTWQEKTDEWRAYNTYNTSDVVLYPVDGVLRRFVAITDNIQSLQTPDESGNWEQIVFVNSIQVWNQYMIYPNQGIHVLLQSEDNPEIYLEFISRTSVSAGQRPGSLDTPWNEVTVEWRFFNVYQPRDFVRHEGLDYIALITNQNVTPGTNSSVWERLD